MNLSEKQHCDSHDDARHCHPGTQTLSCNTHAEGLNLMLLLRAALCQIWSSRDEPILAAFQKRPLNLQFSIKQMAETDCSWHCKSIQHLPHPVFWLRRFSAFDLTKVQVQMVSRTTDRKALKSNNADIASPARRQ